MLSEHPSQVLAVLRGGCGVEIGGGSARAIAPCVAQGDMPHNTAAECDEESGSVVTAMSIPEADA